jgi:hypothetical protein
VRICSPPTKYGFIGSSHWPEPPSRSCVAVADATSASLESSTPLGSPDDPDVVSTTAQSSSSGSSGAAARRTRSAAAGSGGTGAKG